jgi:hypothetical protein
MKLRSPGEAVYVFLLMLLDFRLQQHDSTLWFLFVAPNILLKSQNADLVVKSALTAAAVLLVAHELRPV